MKVFLRSCMIAAVMAVLAACSLSGDECAALDTDIRPTLDRCTALRECSEANDCAYGVLVMPEIAKGALVLGRADGDGSLLVNGKTTEGTA